MYSEIADIMFLSIHSRADQDLITSLNMFKFSPRQEEVQCIHHSDRTQLLCLVFSNI